MGATNIIQAVLLFSTLQAGATIKCYKCDSVIQVQCSSSYSPRESFLEDSGNETTGTAVCYELSSRDPNGTIFVQRGVISRFKEDHHTRLCLGPEGIFPRIGDEVQKKNYSSPRRANTTSLAGQAFNNLQVSARLTKRSNPSTVLKGGEEYEENTRVEANYNCTTCTKDRCNWKQIPDYTDLSENTDDEEADYDLPTVVVPRSTVASKPGAGSAKLSSHSAVFIIHSLLVVYLS